VKPMPKVPARLLAVAATVAAFLVAAAPVYAS
jgi:hypothetical protein